MTKTAAVKSEKSRELRLNWAQLNTSVIEPGDLAGDYSRTHRGVVVIIYERDASDDYPGCYVVIRDANGFDLEVKIERCHLIRKWPEVMRLLNSCQILNLRTLQRGTPVSQVCFPDTPVPVRLKVITGRNRHQRQVTWLTANCVAVS